MISSRGVVSLSALMIWALSFLSCTSKEAQSLCDAVDARNVNDVKRILDGGKVDLSANQNIFQCQPVPNALRMMETANLLKDPKGIEIVGLLFDHGADPNGCWPRNTKSRKKDVWPSECVLEFAVRSRSEDLLALVIARGADPKTSGGGAVMAASESGRLEVVRQLVEAGAPVTNALGLAVRNLHIDVASYLDGRPGANEFPPPRDPSLVDKAFTAAVDGNVQGGLSATEQAFMTAARKGDTKAVNAAIAAGIKVDRFDDYSLSALMRASAWDHLDTVKALLKEGADPNRMNGGKTALHLAAQFGRVDVIHTLLDAKAQINARFSNLDATPLFTAVKAQQVPSIRVLVDAGADTSAGTSTQTALEYAIWVGNVDVVRELLKGGHTPVNARGPAAKESPLHGAINCKAADSNVSLIKAMIGAGADLSAKDQNGDTPLQLVEKKRAAEKLPSYLPCYDAQIATLKAAGAH